MSNVLTDSKVPESKPEQVFELQWYTRRFLINFLLMFLGTIANSKEIWFQKSISERIVAVFDVSFRRFARLASHSRPVAGRGCSRFNVFCHLWISKRCEWRTLLYGTKTFDFWMRHCNCFITRPFECVKFCIYFDWRNNKEWRKKLPSGRH